MKEYKWNEHGVCTNADKITLNVNACKLTVETAERDGLWFYGYEYNNSNYSEYSGLPCMFKFQKGESCQRTAITQAILNIKKQEKPRGEMLRKLHELYFEKAQLLLF